MATATPYLRRQALFFLISACLISFRTDTPPRDARLIGSWYKLKDAKLYALSFFADGSYAMYVGTQSVTEEAYRGKGWNVSLGWHTSRPRKGPSRLCLRLRVSAGEVSDSLILEGVYEIFRDSLLRLDLHEKGEKRVNSFGPETDTLTKTQNLAPLLAGQVTPDYLFSYPTQNGLHTDTLRPGDASYRSVDSMYSNLPLKPPQ